MSNSEANLDQFCRRYLTQWDKRATVRGQPRYSLPKSLAGHEMFPASWHPVLEHEAVRKLGKGARHEFLIRAACQFQALVAELEVDIVAGLCGRLGIQGAGSIPLPHSARQVGLTIATDEVYHALLAREFLVEVRKASGISTDVMSISRDSVGLALANIQEAAPAALRREAETMALCIFENFVTEEMFGLSKKVAVENPFHLILREHMVDEGRHQVFFQKLLRHMWTTFDEETRCAFGRVLPGFLDAFLLQFDSYIEREVELLAGLGFSREQSIGMINESGAAEKRPKRESPHAQNSLSLLKMVGIDSHPPSRAALVDSGWLAP